MDEPGQNLVQGAKPVKNSWMENDALVSAAVKAVEEGHSLTWNRLYRHGGSTFKDFKLAAAWVSRERKKRAFATSGSAALGTKPSSKAAIALSESDLAGEAEKAERENRIRLNPPVPANSIEQKVIDWLKEFAFQFFGILIVIPLGILFGFNYGGGLITRVVSPLVLLVGIVIVLFRFIRAMAISVTSGKPINKDWYE